MVVTVSTDLAIPAARARELALKPPLLEYVLWPWVQMPPIEPLPETITEGQRITAKLRFLGVLPGWCHTLTIQRLGELEIASREHGGPVREWNHRLTFQETSPGSCRYTDSVEIHAGLATPTVVLFAHLIYRYRQWRWRALARVLAAESNV